MGQMTWRELISNIPPDQLDEPASARLILEESKGYTTEALKIVDLGHSSFTSSIIVELDDEMLTVLNEGFEWSDSKGESDGA